MTDIETEAPDELAPSEEEVLADLHQAEAHFRDVVARAQQTTAAMRDAQQRVTSLQMQVIGLQETNAQVVRHLQDTEQAAAEARVQLEGQRARAQQLEHVLQELHKTLFSGNVFDMILRACLTITGATRGLYVTSKGEGIPLRIRAAVQVDGYPQSAPSEFLQSICRQVLRDQHNFVAHSPADLAHLPEPGADTEHFHNCIVAPVSLLKDLNGIVIVADKAAGDFGDDDVQSIISVGNQASVAAENGQLRRQLQEAYLSTVSVLADAMEVKDSYTHGHCEMVSRYARLIARHLNLTDLERSIVSYAALLHDIGKIGVSDGLLNKPGPLLPEERELVRRHVRVGHDLIRHVPALYLVADAVLHHHECYDGTGYPDGLQGDQIPIAARIVCVVDAYSAMITKRSYKEAYSEDWARAELRRCAGTQFDPRVVEAFLYVLDLPDLSALEDDEEADLAWLPSFLASQKNG